MIRLVRLNEVRYVDDEGKALADFLSEGFVREELEVAVEEPIAEKEPIAEVELTPELEPKKKTHRTKRKVKEE